VHGKVGKTPSEKVNPKASSKNGGRREDGLGDMSSGEDSNMDNAGSENEVNGYKHKTKTGGEIAKASVLASSSDEGTVSSDGSAPLLTKDKKEKEKRSKNGTTDKKCTSSATKRPALLNMKLSENDTSEDEAKSRQKASRKKNSKQSDSDGEMNSDPAVPSTRKRKSGKRRKAVMETDDSELEAESEEEAERDEDYEEEEANNTDNSDVGRKKRSRRRKGTSSSENSDADSEDEDKPKRRKRIKDCGSDSDDEKSKGRHNIRKVIKDKNVAKETKTAVAEEKDRRKRIEERQAQYNKMFSLTEEPDKPITKLVLDFDPDSKDVLVEVDKKIVSKLKPHQARGVKFMWDACFESIAQIEEDKVPGGAILAHCMGLGKTLQTITLTHTILSHNRVGVNRKLKDTSSV